MLTSSIYCVTCDLAVGSVFDLFCFFLVRDDVIFIAFGFCVCSVLQAALEQILFI